MIEATCSACGTQNRIAEADVPVGAKFVTCSSCKSRVALPVKTAATLPKLPPPVPPKGPPSGPPSISLGPSGAIPAPPPVPGGRTDEIIDLADLPAPKRQSPLGPAPSRPAPKSGLASALEVDLPAPKPKTATGPISLDLDDVLAPAPPAEPAPPSESVDLPAPKVARPSSPHPAAAPTRAASDTPPGSAPSTASGPAPGTPDVIDLPAPRGARAVTPARATPVAGPVIDLPAPRPKPRAGAERAAPKGPPALADLPAPRPGADLPAPKGPPALADLPAPRPGVDLPAPKGLFDDLPQPARGQDAAADVPAPKGLFDDLPQPARGAPADDVPAPKGFFDDLPQPARGAPADVPAPKGFFDDLPQPGKQAPEAPAPKGFFDDLPQPGKQAPEAPAPKGFFDDLPQPGKQAPEAPAPKGFFDDLPQPSRGQDAGAEPIDLDPGFGEPLDLDSGLDSALDSALDSGAPLSSDDDPLELASPSKDAAPTSSTFDDLDLSTPTAPPPRAPSVDGEPSPIKFSPASKASSAGKDKPAGDQATVPALSTTGGAEVSLELAEPLDRTGPSTIARGATTKTPEPGDEIETARKRRRTRRVLAGVVLGLAVLGGGGFYMYQRHAAQQQRADEIAQHLSRARKALASDDAARWTRAGSAAAKVLELEPQHGEALGISAEAAIAGALADGKNTAGRFARGRKQIADALGAGAVVPAIQRAQAVSAITTSPQSAVPKLEALIAKQPDDLALQLYLGWAHEAAGELPAAVQAYERAATATGGVKLLALLGRGRAKLALADLEGARADFRAVLAEDKDNIPAQVGLAAARTASEIQQQENDLLALLALPAVKDADPRAVVRAWILAADIARNSGRPDVARERYRKALELDDKHLDALTGLALVELRDDKVDAAFELITKALTSDSNHALAQLVATEISMLQGKLDDAAERIDALSRRDPPLVPLDMARLHVVRGRLLDLRRDPNGAVEAFVEAAKLAGERDLAPTMLAVEKLTQLAAQAAADNDPAREAALRARADELLSALATSAEKDPQLAFALGTAYAQAGQAAKAEPWLRRVVEVRPDDPDAAYQLGRVLRILDRATEAVSLLEKARGAAPERTEIAVELARTLEVLGRDDEAGALYDALLAKGDPSLEARAHAGLFYVRTRQLAKAGEQGEKILAIDRGHATGHYLRGEALLAAGQLDEARRAFLAAADTERSARHLDAVGRATESIAMQKGKDYLAMQDTALRSYIAANELEPTLFSSLLGKGRLYVARREMEKAVVELLAAEKSKPETAEVAFHLGVAYQELGTKQSKRAAVEWLQRANKLEQSAETAYRLGQLYTDPDINQERPAIASYDLATRLAIDAQKKTGALPEWYPEALFQLGSLTNAVGNEKAACDAWKKYLGTKPTNKARIDEVQRTIATSLRNCGR